MNNENMTTNIENMEIKKNIAEKLFPGLVLTPDEIEKRYPPRELEEGAMVTRIAPSPTGFMHIGGLYAALISERLAHQTSGVFYLRIEDTDKKREVEGSAVLIPSSLEHYGIKIDEKSRECIDSPSKIKNIEKEKDKIHVNFYGLDFDSDK